MSQLLGKELPAALQQRLSGGEVEDHEGKIIPIFTIDEAGWAASGAVSYYEIVAKNASTLDMALWKDSSTANNLRQTGKVTLMISRQGRQLLSQGQRPRIALRNGRGGAGVALPRHPGAGHRGPRTQRGDYYRVDLSAHGQARSQRFCSESFSLTARGVMKYEEIDLRLGIALGSRRRGLRLLAHGGRAQRAALFDRAGQQSQHRQVVVVHWHLASGVTVLVGSQVSGTIAKLLADFNTKVNEGQIVAQLDQASLRARGRARANVLAPKRVWRKRKSRGGCRRTLKRTANSNSGI